MENRLTDVRRKHTRFPVYDDEIGVKIVKEGGRRRRLFDDSETIITAAFGEELSEQRSLRRYSKPAHEKSGHTIAQQEELERHRANLPDYGKSARTSLEKGATGKARLFGDTRRSSYIVRKKEVETSQAPARREKVAPAYTAVPPKARFVPTYVPASVIPDEPKDGISQLELLEAMKSSKQSLLLLDNDPSDYQEKMSEDDPTVTKFKKEKTPVKMTRSEYKKIGKKKGLFEPKSNKKTVLDRSLSGMIAEDQQSLDENGYFSKN